MIYPEENEMTIGPWPDHLTAPADVEVVAAPAPVQLDLDRLTSR